MKEANWWSDIIKIPVTERCIHTSLEMCHDVSGRLGGFPHERANSKHTLAVTPWNTHTYKTCQHWLGLNAGDGARRLLRSVRALFSQLLGEARHFDTASCYFWFLYILCSELLYKELPPPFLCFFFFSLYPTSSLLVLSLIGRIIRKEFSRESFHLPLIFPSAHTH